MDADLLNILEGFESFLKRSGLVCQRREGPDPIFFGNRVIQYSGEGYIAIRITLDRSQWLVDIGDNSIHTIAWHDVAIIRDLLFGQGEDVLSFAKQVEFVELNWQMIVNCFIPAQMKETSEKLTLLKKERMKRLFPHINRHF
ncbi:MAG TPA: hypothetical protein VMG59_09275 [Phycisphaerae bacterium]|nr:hypothetical protein [Phycisphaerae bacterium]